MWQALALRMGWPIEYLKAQMSHREFAYWCAVYRERPFDDEHTSHMDAALIRADMRALAGNKSSKMDIERLLPYRRNDAANDVERKIEEIL